MAPPISEFERRLQELDGEIKRLELEYMQFQTGRLAKLPWESRKRVETLVKQYDRMHIQNTAERFREVVRAQLTKHAKDGVEVAFRVGVQDGRVVFTAKPKTGTNDE